MRIHRLFRSVWRVVLVGVLTVVPVQVARAAAPTAEPVLSAFVQSMQERLPGLSREECEVMDAAYQSISAKREQVELSLARRNVVTPTSVLIRIPPYAADGANLLAEFESLLVARLGLARGRELMRACEQPFRVMNNNLGTMEQQILIEDQGEAVHIVRSAGAFVEINGRVQPVRGVITSNLLKADLLSYSYLRPLFPLEE